MKSITFIIVALMCFLLCSCTTQTKQADVVESEASREASSEEQTAFEDSTPADDRQNDSAQGDEPEATEEAEVSEIIEPEATEEAEVSEIIEPEATEDEEPSDSAETEITESEVTEPEITEPEASEIQVQEPVYVGVTGITLSTYDVTLGVGHTVMPLVTMHPHNATDKGEIWISWDTSVATVDYLGNIKGVREGQCAVTVTSTDNPQVYETVNVSVLPEAECTYIDGILIANKSYPLPQSYAPGPDAEASSALQTMFAEAKNDGISLRVVSGYRSYIDQKIIYNGYVARDGQAAADRYSARPGHSEHQTGLAFDINSTSSSFAGTPEAKWLAENCHKYGFILRYPKDKEHITGYMYEPWHIRYLGVQKAKEVFDSGLCLEEFLGITSVYSY